MDLIVERPEISYYNRSYLEWAETSQVKYGRRSLIYLNLEGKSLQPWGNNVSMHLIFFELLSNEYRRSFVEMHFKMCNLLNGDPYIGGPLSKALGGITCPVPPGEYHLMNMTVYTESFPNLWPIPKGRVNITLEDNVSHATIGTGSVLFYTKLRNNIKKS